VQPTPNRAVILAAGRGARLGLPGQPKVLAPVAGVPLLLRTLRTLAAAGVRTVVIVVGHRAGDVMAAVAGNEAGLRVAFVRSRRFASTNNAYSQLAANPNIVIIKSLSKAYGVAGLRLGYLACADEDLLGAVLAELPIWNINGPAEAFLRLVPRYRAAFDESIALVRAARDELYTMLCQLPGLAQVYRPEANFVLARLAGPRTAAEIARALLARHGILVKDCSGKSRPRAQSHLPLPSRPRPDNRRLAAALDDVLASLPGCQR